MINILIKEFKVIHMINILIKNFKDILKSINFNYEIVNFDSKSVDIILNC
jgi:hypothetical protein